MTAGRLDAMKKAIVGLVMTVEEIEGSFKLNQHKSAADYASISNALASQGDADAAEIAALMRDARPQAFISETAATNEATTLERNV
jgi:transcriptional regulator